jgi:uncharacterized repeat protein (TIGR02543 family)
VNFPVKVEDVATATTKSYVAKWEANIYTINYYMDGGFHSSETFKMDQTEIGGGFALAVPNGAESGMKGYVFEGWYLSNDFSGEKITALDNSMGIQNPELYKNSEIKLYGKWVKATYTITLLNTDGSVFRIVEVQYGEAVAKLDVLSDMNNQWFNGWNRQDNGTKVTNGNGEWLWSTYAFEESIVLVADYQDN